MNKLKYWLKALPFGLALKIRLLRTLKKFIGLPNDFYYSQTGEDILIYHLLKEAKEGFYIDVGCHDPIRISNTFKLYLLGWNGINIDADKNVMRKVSKVRKLDINICTAVSDTVKEVTYYRSAETPNVNTISAETYETWKSNWNFDIKDQEIITTTTLTNILTEHVAVGKKIDLLTVDVEGHEWEVIKGLDLNLYRPKLIVLECHDFQNYTETTIYKHLIANHYTLAGFVIMNVYFLDTRALFPLDA